MKSLLFGVLFLSSFVTKGQESFFRLDYFLQSLGSNQTKTFFPVIKIEGSRITYTTNATTDGAHIATIRRSSVDSIIAIVKGLQDSVIFRFNACALSGVYHHINIKTEQSAVRFTLINTFDYSAQKIADILNLYLPDNAKIQVERGWKAADEACLDFLKKLDGSAQRR